MRLQGNELEMIILRIRCTHGQKLFSLCMKTYNLYIEKLIFQSTNYVLNELIFQSTNYVLNIRFGT